MRQLTVLLILWLTFSGFSLAAATGKDGPEAKVSPELRALYEAYLAAQRTGTPFTSRDPLVPVVGDRVTIDAVAAGDVAALQADLVALGIRGSVSAGRIVSGQLPIQAIGALASLPSLRFARAAASTTHGSGGRSR